jgi:putative ABC transport system permease protein
MRIRGNRRRDIEFNAELESHVAMHTDDGIRAGLSPEEARRQALIRLGGAEQTQQAYRERSTLPWVENLLRDVRHALRGFRRNPVFTITAIATLALGIGTTTAVFSVVDRILFRSLPYAHDDRLVSVGLVQSLEKQEFMLGGFFYEWRDNQKPFEAVAAQGTMLHACDLVEANPQQLNCITAQAGFLPLLGISPVLGRNFLPEEDKPNGPQVVLISYSLWRDHYNSDRGILDRLIDVDGKPAHVVGVLPKDFELPTVETADVMLPAALDEGHERKAFPGSPMRTFARLKPGVSIAEAKAELDPLFVHTRDTFLPPPIRKDFHLGLRSLRDRETESVQLTAWVLLGSVLAVLLIACTNVGSLLMARGAAREREMAMRSALGASRGRLMRQMLTEATLLSLMGAAAGMVLAEILLRVFLAIAPTGIPFLNRAGLDLRIALFTVLVSLLSGLLFGLLPAVQQPHAVTTIVRGLKQHKSANLRRGLVTGQIAISMVLLAGASLLLKSFRNMEEQSLGMQSQGVLTARIALPGFRYNTPQKKMEFYLQLEAALRRLPGIRAVGMSDSVPPGGWNSGSRFSELVVEGRPQAAPGTGGSLVNRLVTPDYFRALDIPIVRGLNFTEEDRKGSDYKVVLSRQLAARLFAGDDPIGKRMQIARGGPWLTIVGVAENVKNNGLTGQNDPEMYRLRRSTDTAWSVTLPVLLIDSVLSPKAVAPWVRAQVAAIDPTVPVVTETLAQSVSKLGARQRFETALVGFFALCGLLMAAIGLYGVVAYVAAQRTQEIGVRMALGATRMDILRLIAGEGMRLIVLGGVVGLGAAFASARLLKSLLFEVGTHDPESFIVVPSLLALIAIVATLIPARAAMKTDPMRALRTE